MSEVQSSPRAELVNRFSRLTTAELQQWLKDMSVPPPKMDEGPLAAYKATTDFYRNIVKGILAERKTAEILVGVLKVGRSEWFCYSAWAGESFFINVKTENGEKGCLIAVEDITVFMHAHDLTAFTVTDLRRSRFTNGEIVDCDSFRMTYKLMDALTANGFRFVPSC